MNRFRELRTEARLSQVALADKLNVHQTAVSQWELEKSFPDIDLLKKMSKIYGVSVDYLVGNVNDPFFVLDNKKIIADINSYGDDELKKLGIKIPVLGEVVAGVPIEAIEDILDYEEITEEMANKGEHFALKVKGDSMEPVFYAGDIVIVRQQPTADSGDIVIALVNGDESTIKKLKLTDDGLMLIPANSAYEPMYYSHKQIDTLPVSIIGKVVELRRSF